MTRPNIEDVVDAALAAADVLRSYFRQANTVTAKSASNFVSQADVASEQLLRQQLAEIAPRSSFLGEEGGEGDAASAESRESGRWIVDPLDGTTNFLHGLPNWAISIGWQIGDRVELGVVHIPMTGETFTATADSPARRNGEMSRVSSTTELTEALLAFGFFYDRDAAMAATLAALEEILRSGCHGIRRFGAAAIDLCMLASGQTDGFFEFQLQPWDFAAGGLILQQSGGQITDALGEPLPPSGPSSVVATNGQLHGELLRYATKYYRQSQS